MQTQALALRVAKPDDLAAVDALMARSYPRLLKADYAPSVMVTAVPRLARAKPSLLASGRYFVAETGDGAILGAGGWSIRSLAHGLAELRHLAVDPGATRQGIGRRIVERILAQAKATGMRRIECLATRTARPFYTATGFHTVGEVEIALDAGISFPAIRMWRPL